MLNPYKSPTVESPPVETNGSVVVRWRYPTFNTFCNLVILWSFSCGIIVGIGVLLGSLFDASAKASLFSWRLEGFWAGCVLGVVMPIMFAVLGVFICMWFPLVRLWAWLTGGLTLRFHTEKAENLRFSNMWFVSFLKIGSICGCLLGLAFGMLTFLALVSSSPPQNVKVAGIPSAMWGIPDSRWLIIAIPLLYTIYMSVFSVPAWLVFRVISRRLKWARVPIKETVETSTETGFADA